MPDLTYLGLISERFGDVPTDTAASINQSLRLSSTNVEAYGGAINLICFNLPT